MKSNIKSNIKPNIKIVVGKGSCGIAAGANKIGEYFGEYLGEYLGENSEIDIGLTGCIGMCYLEPIVDIVDGTSKKTYVKVTTEVADEIIKSLEGKKNSADKYLIAKEDQEIREKQVNIALKNSGIIDPENIDEYIATGGYEALKKCLTSNLAGNHAGNLAGDLVGNRPEAIINELKISGLAGRGGAGFPTWFKWQAARDSASDKKYIICNADEGDPGAFMDRAIIEGDPHALIEGMVICAYAICHPNSVAEGAVYVRAEYPLAITRLENAIQDATKRGFLGENILGLGFNFTLKIKAGAGAFVCGEETALIASLEGERGMPRLKPPFPAQSGFWGKPSNINNVETYANIPWIIRSGGKAFAKMGTEDSKGTKVFALTGKLNKGGLVEIPMGSTIREVIFDIGGGIKDGKNFKAVQMGGPSGGCIPADKMDTVISYKEIAKTGAIMGSGGMVVMDEDTCMVDMARFFLDFTCKESCGKCAHCRISTKRMLEVLDRLTKGEGKDGDIELLEDLSHQIKDGALCGLGQTAPNPVLTTINYFRNEYEDHINKKCTARQCMCLIAWTIDRDKCVGCSLCAKKCPSGAISGEVKTTYVIDPEKCTKCDICRDVCKFDAVIVE